jgi:hypothetical protein
MVDLAVLAYLGGSLFAYFLVIETVLTRANHHTKTEKTRD